MSTLESTHLGEVQHELERLPIAEDFVINVPDSELDDKYERLRRARLPDDYDNDQWQQGFNTDYLRELIAYWIEDYDWRAVERRMNQRHHFRLALPGFPFHYLHERGKGPEPMPLLINHGWPWTFWDLDAVVGPLTDPVAHGGSADDSFDVVVASLPGHGFSSPLRESGWNFHRTADLEVRVMQETLGYEKFAVAGGDHAALIASQLGHKYAERLIGLYCHMPLHLSCYALNDNPDTPPGIEHVNGYPVASEYAPDESSWAAETAHFFAAEAAYVSMHLTKPQTLAAALNDSPAAQLAWIVEKRRTWADTGGDIESVWTKDDLCTVATLYWLTQTGGKSARFYKESAANAWQPSHGNFPVVQAPSALAVYTKDVIKLPRSWAEKYYNVQQYRVHAHGGHFAPAEVPDVWLDDVRTFFRRFR